MFAPSLTRSSVLRQTIRTAAVALVAVTAAASVVRAQAPVSGNFTFRGDMTSNGTLTGTGASPVTVQVGPYKADLAGYTGAFSDRTNAPVWTVDFVNANPTTGTADTYWATRLNGADFTKTSRGSAALYQKAAWLIEQYDAGAANFTAVNVQGTIWKLFNSGTAPTTGFTDLSSSIAATPTLTKTWYVMSDNMTGDVTQNAEFLVSAVPEPSTYLLMAVGLGAVGVMARRRRAVAVAP